MILRHTSRPSLRRLRRPGLALVAAALLGGCFNPSGGEPLENQPTMVFVLPDSDVSAVVRDADESFVSELDDEHVIGGSPCPQLLGTVTVSNESEKAATATLALATEDPLAIDLPTATAEVPPGESVDLTVEFNCMAIDDIDTTLELSLATGERIGVFEIPLRLDVMM